MQCKHFLCDMEKIKQMQKHSHHSLKRSGLLCLSTKYFFVHLPLQCYKGIMHLCNQTTNT